MFFRVLKNTGFTLFVDEICLVKEFHDLMMTKEGERLFKVLIASYDVFSPYFMDIADDGEREKVACLNEFGAYDPNMLKAEKFILARKKFIELNQDTEVEQIRNVEFSIKKLTLQRESILKGQSSELGVPATSLSSDDLKMIKDITSALKDMFEERERLMEHFTDMIKSSAGKGKTIGNKKLGFLARTNSMSND